MLRGKNSMKDKAIIVPWFVTRGNSDSVELSLIDQSTNAIIPFVAGDTVIFSVKMDVNQSTYILHKEITTFEDGMVTIDLHPEDTNLLDFGSYVYDVMLSRADGFKQHLIDVSPFKVLEVVTHE